MDYIKSLYRNIAVISFNRFHLVFMFSTKRPRKEKLPSVKTDPKKPALWVFNKDRYVIRIYVSPDSKLEKACQDQSSAERLRIALFHDLYEQFSARVGNKDIYVAWLRPLHVSTQLEIFAEFNMKHPDRFDSSLASCLAHQTWVFGSLSEAPEIPGSDGLGLLRELRACLKKGNG